MGWVTPFTSLVNDLLTAAHMNETRDNLNDLDRRATATGGTVAASETTTSTSYTNLATSGPVAVATVGANGKCLVTVTAKLFNSGTNTSYMAFAVSGATTVAASDAQSLDITSAIANAEGRMSATYLVTGLTAGSNTFTAKYRCTAGTTTAADRNIIAIPLSS